MSGRIEFRDNANAAVVRVCDQVADFGLRVELPFGTHSGQLGEHFALGAEPLVVRKMPVEDVHFYGGHAIEIAIEHIDGNEMTAGVDHQATPLKTRLIFDGDCRGGESARANTDKLQKRLQAVKRA